MFKRFTERARRVIILAREEAERHHHEYLGTEHILLGMLKDGGGIAITVLQKAGLSIDQIRMEVERHLPRNANALIVGRNPVYTQSEEGVGVRSRRSTPHGAQLHWHGASLAWSPEGERGHCCQGAECAGDSSGGDA